MPGLPIIDFARLDFSKPLHDRGWILKALPHRGHMQHLDAIVFLSTAERIIVGYKNVRADEFWCDGHFPGNPLLPGVIQLEAACQLSVILYKAGLGDQDKRLVVFGGADEVRFRGAVRPGDRLDLVASTESFNPRGSRARIQGFVAGKMVFEGVNLGIPT